MTTAIPKAADNKAAGARAPSRIIDTLADGVVVEVKVTDQLLGAMMRGKVDRFVVSIVGAEWEKARRASRRAQLKAVE